MDYDIDPDMIYINRRRRVEISRNHVYIFYILLITITISLLTLVFAAWILTSSLCNSSGDATCRLPSTISKSPFLNKVICYSL